MVPTVDQPSSAGYIYKHGVCWPTGAILGPAELVTIQRGNKQRKTLQALNPESLCGNRLSVTKKSATAQMQDEEKPDLTHGQSKKKCPISNIWVYLYIY